MLKIRQLCVTSLLLVSGVASAANVRLQVEGLSGELEKNVRAQLSTIQSDEVTPDRRFRARVDDAIREGLKALGYYEPTIEFDLRPPPKRGRQVLIAKVTPGEPVRIGGTEVILRGGARTDSDYLALLKTRPAIGTVLNHGDYDGFKSSLTRVALRKGYFDSEFLKSQLGVSLDRHQAFWDIDYDSGERYRFGHVTFSGSQIRDEYLQNLVPFKEGDYYTSQDLAELNRRLAATGWFSSVVENQGAASAGRCLASQREHRGNRGRLFHRRRSAGESHVEKTMGQLVWPQPDLQRQPLRPGAAVRLYL